MQLKEAIHLHFNFTTPFRSTSEDSAPGQPRPERARKRSVTNLAAVLAHIGRGGRSLAPKAATTTTAPRALHFPDSSEDRGTVPSR